MEGQSTLKALVLPGTYVLWLYDVPRDRNVSFTQCSPFTMSLRISHVEQMEDFLNCDGTLSPFWFQSEMRSGAIGELSAEEKSVVRERTERGKS